MSCHCRRLSRVLTLVVGLSLSSACKERVAVDPSVTGPDSGPPLETAPDPTPLLPLPDIELRDTTPELQQIVDSGPAPLSEDRRTVLMDLIRTAFDGSAGARLATRAAESLGDEDGIDLALEWGLAHAESPLVRANCARVLGERSCFGALPRLIHRTKYEKDWSAYVALCEAMAVLGNDCGALLLDALIDVPQAQGAAGSGALRFLQTVGRPQPADVSWAALRAELRQVGEHWRTTGRPFLGDGLADGATREVAPVGDPLLNARLAQRILDMLESNLRSTDDARLVLRNLGTVGLETLRFGILDTNPQIRLPALEVARDLRAVAQPLTSEILAQLDDFITGTIAAIALGRIGDPRALPHLLARARSESLETRQAAVEGLAWLRHPDAQPVLRARLRDPEEIEGVRVQAALGLALYDEGRRYLLGVQAAEGYHAPTLSELLDHIATERARMVGTVR